MKKVGIVYETDEAAGTTVTECRLNEHGCWAVLAAIKCIENALDNGSENWTEYAAPKRKDALLFDAGHTKKEPGKEYTQYDVIINIDNRTYLVAVTFKAGKLDEYVRQDIIEYLPAEACDD